MEENLYTDENWTRRIEKLAGIIQLWGKRDLSIVGKVIVKCFWRVN